MMPGARPPEADAEFRRRGAQEVVDLAVLAERRPQIGVALGPRLDQVVAVDRGRHRDACAPRLHELEHAALAEHVLEDHAVGPEREIAVAGLERLAFGVVEMAEQHLVGERQRPRDAPANDPQVAIDVFV